MHLSMVSTTASTWLYNCGPSLLVKQTVAPLMATLNRTKRTDGTIYV